MMLTMKRVPLPAMRRVRWVAGREQHDLRQFG